ncbi:IS200/IS605 family transposase [Geobacillus sp. 46C-IIa]|uniref:IS200/IS605 family transposase n=1 Tax=Geobacillus sp. 46C-IIa TaxID=1963025 RepID=UPI002102F779|nr:IS200/IS605 family transposase [Geobacillus sp. 46C-IIa]
MAGDLLFCTSFHGKAVFLESGVFFFQLAYKTMEVMPDHCYLFLNCLPMDSPSAIMAKVKGVTSRILRQEFKHLAHLPSLWTRSFFVSTAGNVSSETIKRYVEAQKKRG